MLLEVKEVKKKRINLVFNMEVMEVQEKSNINCLVKIFVGAHNLKLCIFMHPRDKHLYHPIETYR